VDRAPNNSQPAATATVSVNSSSSFFTTGPMIAISVRLAGSTWASDSSWRPPIRSCTAISISTAEVTEKNGLSGILSEPRANSTPNTSDSPSPIVAPSHSPSPWTVEVCGRQEHRGLDALAEYHDEGEQEHPNAGTSAAGRALDPRFDSCLKCGADFHIHTTAWRPAPSRSASRCLRPAPRCK
jgi:hypothetical protein